MLSREASLLSRSSKNPHRKVGVFVFAYLLYTADMKSTKYYLGAGIALAALLAAGLYTLGGREEAPAPGSATSTPATASSTSVTAGGVTLTADGGKVELVPIESAKAPSLLGEIYVAGDIPAEVQAQLRANLVEIIARLKKDPKDLGLWIDLGNNRRIAKDYTGAVEAWSYVAEAAPDNYVAFNNLGDLYMSVLKDYPKAEANFKRAIVIKSDVGDLYRSLYMLYLYYYKTDTSAARETLELGIKNNPGNQDLKDLLSEYNKTHVQ